jgi:hypothetical protein
MLREGTSHDAPAPVDPVTAPAPAAGLSDEEIAETIGHVAVNVLTNYFNKAAGVAIDFPAVAA